MTVFSERCPMCDYHNMAMSEKPYNEDCEYFGMDEYSDQEKRPIAGTCEHYEYKGKAGWTKKEEIANGTD